MRRLMLLGMVGCWGSSSEVASAPAAPSEPAAPVIAPEAPRPPDAGEPAVVEPPPAPTFEAVKSGVSSGNIRRVEIAVGATGWSPERIEAKPNEPVALVFTREGEVGCAELVVPITEARIPLNAGGKTSVMVTAPTEGEMALQCGNGAGGGAVFVADPAAAPEAPAAAAPTP
jgi:hypothetical protein